MADPVLQAQELHKSFGRRRVLRGVSFSVSPGNLVGIVGENGSGKSTLLRIIAGDLRPNGGGVISLGPMGYCPQTAILNEALTVDQHLDFFRAAYKLGDHDRAGELMEKLGYRRYRQELVANLSGGTKQKLNLTLALMHQPKLLLLDEPYQGFDWETYLCFWKLVMELRNNGCGVLVISHLFFEQKRFDVLYRLQDGRVQLQGRVERGTGSTSGAKENQ